MASKLFILCLFAIVLIGLVVADDYEGEGGEAEQTDDGGAVDESYDGGDYESGGDGGDYAAAQGDENEEAAAASEQFAQYIRPALNRQKRSLNTDDSKRVLRRVRRGGHGRVGPVYTGQSEEQSLEYQKTDHHGNFKWGVRHMVGKHAGK